jgi:hypothetical protein
MLLPVLLAARYRSVVKADTMTEEELNLLQLAAIHLSARPTMQDGGLNSAFVVAEEDVK